MPHGLQIFNGSGQARVSVTDRLTRLAHSSVVGPTSSGSATVAGINASNAVAISQVVDASASYICPHEVWITANTLNWAAIPAPGASSSDTRGTSLLQVFRYA